MKRKAHPKARADKGSCGFERISDELYHLYCTGQLLQNRLGYSKLMLEQRYSFAFDLFSKGEYSDALQVFSHLTLLNPLVKGYWTARAACEIKTHEKWAALRSLSMAARLDPEDPNLYFRAALCYSSLGGRSEAAELLQRTITTSQGKAAYSAIANQAKQHLKVLEEGS